MAKRAPPSEPSPPAPASPASPAAAASSAAAGAGPHLVLSRKYRPGRFGELVGQEHVAQTLSNAITSGRIGHAYLFIGPRGTGKTTTARIFAKALNCERGPTPEPCGVCGSCVGITKGNDLDVVEMDAASNNGVDDVRALRDSVGYRPSRSRFRIWIVDEVHMLSLAAFNAFLKTLEEPPPQAKFLFCTTEAHKLPETFLSRVQRLEFRRIDETLISTRLEALAAKEGLALEPGVCTRIASGALGGLRDAESLLEQLLSCAHDGRVTLADLDAVSGRAAGRAVEALLVAVGSGDAGAALDAAGACLSSGAKPDVVLDQTVEAFRGLLSLAARRKPGMPAPEPGTDLATERALAFGLPRIARSLDLLLEKRRHLKDGADGRLVVEVAAVELARLPSARDLDALVTALARATPLAEPASAGPAGPAGPMAGGGGGTATSGSSAFGPSSGSRGYTPPPAAVSPVGPAAVAPPSRATASPFGASGPSRYAAPEGARGPDSVREGPAPSGSGASGAGGSGGAAAGVAAGAATVALATVLAAWPAVIAGVGGRSRRVGSALARTRVTGVGADVVTLAIAAGDIVAKGTLREREATDHVREVTRAVLGVTLRPAVEDEVPGAVATSAVSGPSSAEGSPPPSFAGGSGAAGLPTPSATTVLPNQGLDAASPQVQRGRSDPGTVLPSQGLDEVRAHPTVKAVLDAFGARVLAVQRVEGDLPPPTGAAGGASGKAS